MLYGPTTNVYSISSSDGGNRNEDCTLAIWDQETLSEPAKDSKMKKNHDGKLRNCVHPKLVTNTNIFVLVVAEYMHATNNDVFTGFIS